MASNKITGLFQAIGGIVNTYKLLLGDRVIRDATKKLGKDKLKEFLKLQHRYDVLVTKNPALDPLRKIEPTDIPVFDSFEDYVQWLGTIERTLKILKNPIQQEMHKIVEALISSATAHEKAEASALAVRQAIAGIDSYLLDGEPVTAAVKGAEAYHWFNYTGKRGLTIVHGNKRSEVTISNGDCFGLRPSTSGKFYRMVTVNTGLTRVFTVDPYTYQKLIRFGAGTKTPRKIEYSVKASLATVTDSEIVAAQAGVEVATAGVHFHSNRFVSHLNVPVNVRRTSTLPSSYPSFAQTYSVVSSVAYEKQYVTRLHDTLNSVLREKMEALVAACERQRGVKVKSVPEYMAEAHEYLVDHKWLQYELETVAQASYNLAVAGVSHRVTTKGDLVELMHPRTFAYAFLGVALESAMRKAIVALVRDSSNNTVLAGYTAGFDVVVAAASAFIQQEARNWFDNAFTRLR